MTVQPRQLLHVGWVNARGLVIARAALGENASRRRALAAWTAGCRLYQLGEAWALLFSEARWTDSRREGGSVLVDCDGLQSSCPLTTDERAAFAKTNATTNATRNSAVELQDGIVIVAGGRANLIDLDDPKVARRIDPSSWIDVEAFCWIPTTALETPPPAAVVAVNPAAAPDVSRELIGGLGEAPSARQELRIALANVRAGRAADGTEGAIERRQRSRVGTWFSKMLSRSPWTKLIGRQHAKYLRSMAKMFETGDFDRALLHAIPASDVASASAEPTMSRLGPRAGIEIAPRQTVASSVVGLGEDSHHYLRDLYRRAYERLARDGRVEEAAYVLLELLGEVEEGVAYLDKHGRSELAAEVAEARELAPGLVVRLWFRAGDAARAVRFARRTGCFADAVVRLGRVDAEAAVKLRLLWADHAAASGDYATAVDAAWPLEFARHLARDWLDRAIEVGGPLAARMLVKKLTLAPELAPAIMQRAHELSDEQTSEGARARIALGCALTGGPTTELHLALGDISARGLLRDIDRAPSRELQQTLQPLIQGHVPAVMREDMPALQLSPAPLLNERTEVQSMALQAEDTGAVSILDAAFLPSGRMLVALGELGLQLRGRRGQLITHFDCPAHQLAVSANGLRAIALAPRGDAFQLTRIDVDQRRARPWSELELTTWSADFHGALWFVSSGDDVLALDTTADSPECLWRVAESAAHVLALASDTKNLAIWWRRDAARAAGHHAADVDQLWTYDLPALRLRARYDCKDDNGPLVQCAVAPAGDACTMSRLSAANSDTGAITRRTAARLWSPRGRDMHMRADLGTDRLPRSMSNQWLITQSVADQHLVLRLHDSANACARLCVALAGATTASARLCANALTIGDDRGRVLVIDTVTGTRIRDLRIAL